MTAEIVRQQTPSLRREATLRGCALLILHLPGLAGSQAYLPQLDLTPHTYSRTLAEAELLALARLNPDDSPARAAHQVIVDLAVALELLREGGWEGLPLVNAQTGAFIPNVLLTPFTCEELTTVGRLAAEMIAAIGVAR
jgi:hypothetical protein